MGTDNRVAGSIGSRAALLAACGIASQVAIIASLPLLARLYSPAAMGVYTLFVGALAIASVPAGLRYESALILPRTESVASALAGLVLCLAIVVMVVCIGLSLALWALLREPVAGLSWLEVGVALALATLLWAVQRVQVAWYTRDQRFGLVGLGQVVLNAGIVVTQLALGVAGFLSARFLIWGHVAALALAAGLLAVPLAGNAFSRMVSGWSPRAFRSSARRYRRFPKFMVAYGLAGQLRERLFHAMLAAGAGVAQVGQFGLAVRLTGAPNTLAYASISPVFYSFASRNPAVAVGRVTASLIEMLSVALALPFLVVALESKGLVELLLGPQWGDAARYLAWLALPMYVLAATCWIDRLFDVYGRQKFGLWLEAGFFVVVTLQAAILFLAGHPDAVVPVFAITSTAYYLLYARVAIRASGIVIGDLRRVVAVTVGSVVVGGMTWLILPAGLPTLARLLTYFGAYITLVVAWLARGGRSRVSDVFGAKRAPTTLGVDQ